MVTQLRPSVWNITKHLKSYMFVKLD
eukprot:SAG31_NODE_22574_length_522_cov_1.330969_2_plen_25_part_01